MPVSPAEHPGLTECDRDCLAPLAQAQEPLSAARVRRDRDKRGIVRPHGEVVEPQLAEGVPQLARET
jgi:hypothetical protein